MSVRPHERLIVWQESYALCLEIYNVTFSFPKEERFALCTQMRKCAYSVPSNIAEGNGRRFPKEKLHFLDIAKGSLEELHCQSRISKDLQYGHPDIWKKIFDHIERVSYLLAMFRKSLPQ